MGGACVWALSYILLSTYCVVVVLVELYPFPISWGTKKYDFIRPFSNSDLKFFEYG